MGKGGTICLVEGNNLVYPVDPVKNKYLPVFKNRNKVRKIRNQKYASL